MKVQADCLIDGETVRVPERVNADFDELVIQRPEDAVWWPSPQPGVTRRMLDRIGAEVARATSVVRYAPNSRFNSHVHGGGEEILVLEGVFGDEHGRYPAGYYLRNPPESCHAPFSVEGCLLFVKLCQFATTDTRTSRIDTAQAVWSKGDAPGIEVLSLHVHGKEAVTLECWSPGATCVRAAPEGGEEIYLLEGGLYDAGVACSEGTWLRGPASSPRRQVSARGCRLYRKTGHLPAH